MRNQYHAYFFRFLEDQQATERTFKKLHELCDEIIEDAIREARKEYPDSRILRNAFIHGFIEGYVRGFVKDYERCMEAIDEFRKTKKIDEAPTPEPESTGE